MVDTTAEVTKLNVFSMQVCVPAFWLDEDVLNFAERENPCGVTGGWQIRRKGDEALKGHPERNPCGEREGYVHIMLDC